MLAADDSLAEIRARSKFGMAIAAIIKIIATTINSSINEKPFFVYASSIPLLVILFCVILITNSSRCCSVQLVNHRGRIPSDTFASLKLASNQQHHRATIKRNGGEGNERRAQC